MKKILLIEDDSNYIWHIKNFLQRKGYHVLVAFTVSQGKELIEKEQILIIGSDLKLSDGSGMELLEYLREKTYKFHSFSLHAMTKNIMRKKHWKRELRYA